MRTSLASKYAFSLVEVLIALALFAISLTVLSFSINSAFHGLIGFESKIDREEDLRFLRSKIPYTLSKEALLSGGKLQVPHAGEVLWSAHLELSPEVVDLWAINITYEFPTLPHEWTEHYERFVTDWMDVADRSARIKAKKDSTQNDNRLIDPSS